MGTVSLSHTFETCSMSLRTPNEPQHWFSCMTSTSILWQGDGLLCGIIGGVDTAELQPDIQSNLQVVCVLPKE